MDHGLNQVKKRNLHPDRIQVSPAALDRLSFWIHQVAEQLPGVRVTRGDLVNLLILGRSDQMSQHELSQIRKQHFDEVRFAQWAVEELRSRKAKGEKVSLAEIIAAAQNEKIKKPKPQSKMEICEKIAKIENTDPSA